MFIRLLNKLPVMALEIDIKQTRNVIALAEMQALFHRCQALVLYITVYSSCLILYAVGEAADTYCIVCKMNVFVVISDEKAQKRTNIPKICSFYIDSSF